MAENGDLAGTAQEEKGEVWVEKSDIRKGNEVDYRLVNLRECVQLRPHVRKGASVEQGRDAE